MFYRLVKLCTQSRHRDYWILALRLMEKSTVYRLISLRKLEPNWFYMYGWRSTIKILQKLGKIIDKLPTELKVRRKYVLSPPPKKRSLGEPNKETRMFLYQLQCFMVIYLHGFINKSQHGFRPGYGCLTAWQEIMKFMHLPYIWEFDLRNAFPSLSVDWTIRQLRTRGCPYPVTDYIQNFSVNTIEKIKPEKMELPEPKIELQTLLANPFGLTGMGTGPNMMDPSTFALFAKGYMSEMNPFSTGIEDPLENMRHIGDLPIERRGFIQGSGLSPIMFSFGFECALTSGHFKQKFPGLKIIAYADDFLAFFTRDIPTIFTATSTYLKESGLQINKLKSGALRSKTWLKDQFKFLGLTWDSVNSRIIGDPRRGRQLPMDKNQAIEFFVQRQESLSQFVEYFPEFNKNPNAILNAWGLGEEPYCNIPTEVIAEGAPFTAEMAADMRKLYPDKMETESIKTEPIGGDKLTPSPIAPPFVPLNIATDLPEGWYSTGERGFVSPFGWLSTKIAGTILARLYSGSWLDVKALPDLAVWNKKPHPNERGKSWLQLASSQQATRHGTSLNVFNASSFASLDLIKYTSDKNYCNPKAGIMRYKDMKNLGGFYDIQRSRVYRSPGLVLHASLGKD